jgi:serine protease Do
VKLADGTYHVAEVVGLDPPTDIALLRIRAGHPLPAVPLGDSDALEIGDWVVAIGNPFGLENTITAGIVSAKERHDINPSGRQSMYYSYIQTDAAINPGNSGGPLFNLAGEVVGINAAVNTMAQGLGFAIPINMAKELLPALHEHGSVRRSGIGIAIQPLDPDLSESFHLESTAGALVNEVVPGSPGANAGLRVGDVVVSFDGRPVRDAQTLPLLASTAGVGREVELAIVRGGERQAVRVRLNELPGQTPVQRPPAPPNEAPVGDTGMLVRDLQAGERRNVGRNGVLVTQLDPASAAARAGVEREDVVVSVNGTETPDARTFLSTVTATPHGRIVRLLVVHGQPAPQGAVYLPKFIAYRR